MSENIKIISTPKELNIYCNFTKFRPVSFAVIMIIASTLILQMSFQYNFNETMESSVSSYPTVNNRSLLSKISQPSTPEGLSALQEEINVVVAQFSNNIGDTTDIDINILEIIEGAALQVSNVTVTVIDYSIENRDEAKEIGQIYNASVVIYGQAQSEGVNVYYEIIPQEQDYRAKDGFYAPVIEIENFEMFLYSGVNTNYFLQLNIGQFHYLRKAYSLSLNNFSLAENVLDMNYADELQADVLYLYRGNAYANLGDYDHAIPEYDQAIILDPDDGLNLINRAAAYINKNEYILALADLDQAITLAPNNSSNYLNRGNAYYAQGDIARAVVDYDRAIELAPDNVAAYVNRGFAYYNLGEYARAIGDFDQALILTSDLVNVNIYFERGLAYYALGNYAQAIADFDYVIEVNPELAAAYDNRGLAYYAQGNLVTALADYDRAIELDNNNENTYSNRGLAYYSQGEYVQAISDFDRAIELAPNFANAYYNRGLTYYAQGNYPLAISDYDRVIEINPDDASAYTNRGSAFFSQAQYTRAIEDYNHAIEINPESRNAYWGRGNTHYRMGNYEEAIADYRMYEQITGRLEDFMIVQIAEMQASLIESTPDNN